MYRKFTGNNIFTGQQILPEGNVLITNENGVVDGIVAAADAGDNIETFNGIISPGFVNAHCHLELSHLKGRIPEKTGLVEFVFKIITERHFAEDEIVAAIATAEDEMLQNGIVAVGDICNNALTIPQKKKERLYYHNFIEVSGFVPAFAQDRFDRSVTILEQYRSAAKENDQYSIFNDQCSTLSPHAPYSVSPQLFELINNATENKLVTIHNQETAAEEEFIKNKTGDFLKLYEKMGSDISFFTPTGKSSLQSWYPGLNKNQSTILVHNVTTSTADISFTKIQNLKSEIKNWFCLCPNANLYITNSLPDVNMLIQEQCNIVLGTDSLASNHQLNILEEIKTLQSNFPQLKLETMLQWATINGATALQMDSRLGSFEKGKKPGVVLIEGVENQQLDKNSISKRIL
ncbi:amidohydrolase family protein [Ferruginibacter sp. SUN106]|uniref:amidohydrolase family protein n=1 Tax=Ferruginibacter sp. SUN106 TaxID=2978348 RepID=UPI003D367BA9